MASSGYKKLEDGPCPKAKPRRTRHSNKPCIAVESGDDLTDYNKYKLTDYIFKNIIGFDLINTGPFGANKGMFICTLSHKSRSKLYISLLLSASQLKGKLHLRR